MIKINKINSVFFVVAMLSANTFFAQNDTARKMIGISLNDPGRLYYQIKQFYHPPLPMYKPFTLYDATWGYGITFMDPTTKIINRYAVNLNGNKEGGGSYFYSVNLCAGREWNIQRKTLKYFVFGFDVNVSRALDFIKPLSVNDYTEITLNKVGVAPFVGFVMNLNRKFQFRSLVNMNVSYYEQQRRFLNKTFEPVNGIDLNFFKAFSLELNYKLFRNK